MSGRFHYCWSVALLFAFLCCSFFCRCYGENKKDSFDVTLSAYIKSLQKLDNVSFSYQWKEIVDGVIRDRRMGKMFFDQKNIRDEYTETRAGDDREAQFETVIAPEWERYIWVARGEQLDPTVISCLKVENIPSVFRSLGSTNLLFGRFNFRGEEVYLPEVLKSLGSNNVTISDNARNQKEICFVYQGNQFRMLLDTEFFVLVLFECTGYHQYEALEFQNIDGVSFPSKIISTTQISSSRVTYEYLLSDVNFAALSEKDFQFSLNLPNGTSVHMQDARQIQYIWLDGKIVPKTDEAMLAIARGGHKFMPGPDSPRFWLMAIGIILILIGGGRLAYKYFRGEATL